MYFGGAGVGVGLDGREDMGLGVREWGYVLTGSCFGSRHGFQGGGSSLYFTISRLWLWKARG